MFVDAINSRGEVQAVPEHYLTAFPDQFRPVPVAKQPVKPEVKEAK